MNKLDVRAFCKFTDLEKYLYHHKDNIVISEIIEESEFLKISNGNGYENWDNNYFCMLEQLISESIIGA
jgi:hypothetical protein